MSIVILEKKLFELDLCSDLISILGEESSLAMHIEAPKKKSVVFLANIIAFYESSCSWLSGAYLLVQGLCRERALDHRVVA